MQAVINLPLRKKLKILAIIILARFGLIKLKHIICFWGRRDLPEFTEHKAYWVPRWEKKRLRVFYEGPAKEYEDEKHLALLKVMRRQ